MTHTSVHSSRRRISLNGIQLSYCDGISIHLRARHNSLLALIPLSKDANQLSVDDPVISLWQTSSIWRPRENRITIEWFSDPVMHCSDIELRIPFENCIGKPRFFLTLNGLLMLEICIYYLWSILKNLHFLIFSQDLHNCLHFCIWKMLKTFMELKIFRGHSITTWTR